MQYMRLKEWHESGTRPKQSEAAMQITNIPKSIKNPATRNERLCPIGDISLLRIVSSC